MIEHVFRRAVRSLWENPYLNVVATGVIAAALLLLGVFLTIEYNLSSIIDSWDRDVHLSAYFEPQITESARFAARDRIAAMPGVEEVRYVSEADAKAWLLEQVGGMEEVLDQVGSDALPASLEITLTAEQAEEPAAIAAFAKSLSSPEFQDIDFGQQWVERFNAFLSLLKLLAAILGSLIALAAMFLVANTVDLIVFNRKAELEIERLVGATRTFIVSPFVLEGLLQGAVGSCFAVGALVLVHRLLVTRLQEALDLGIAGTLEFLPATYLLGLVVAGALVGSVASGAAAFRFLVRAP
jgi:cell division transport system permease protein